MKTNRRAAIVIIVAAVAAAIAVTHARHAREKPPAREACTSNSNFRPIACESRWIVAPWLPANELAAATSVAVNSRGEIFVAAAWDTVRRVEAYENKWRARNVIDNSAAPETDKKLRVYSLVVDDQDVLWGYNFTSGDLHKLTRNKHDRYDVTTYHFDELFTTDESVAAIGPGGKVLLAVNRPLAEGDARADLYQFDPATKKLVRLTGFGEAIKALVWRPRGRRVCVALARSLYEMDLTARQPQALMAKFPEEISFGGLAAGANGELFVAAGDWAESGRLYKVISADAGKQQAVAIYETKGPGFQGIFFAGAATRMQKEEALFGVCRRSGDLYRLPLQHLDAHADYRLIVGNGLAVPQMLAWDPGAPNRPPALIVSDGETGRLLRAPLPGRPPATIAEIVNYSHLGSQMAVDRASGEIFFAVNAPGFEKDFGVVAVDPRGPAHRPLLDRRTLPEIWPGSVATLSDGALLVSNLRPADQLLRVGKNGQAEVWADRAQVPSLLFPLGLATAPDGGIYVGVSLAQKRVFAGLPWSDAILKLTRQADGWRSQIAFNGADSLSGENGAMCPAINSFSVDPHGEIYVACDRRVLHASPPYQRGPATVFADEFNYALGTTFDDAGDLFVSDGATSSIWRFTPIH